MAQIVEVEHCSTCRAPALVTYLREWDRSGDTMVDERATVECTNPHCPSKHPARSSSAWRDFPPPNDR